jgi:hypothetical protein
VSPGATFAAPAAPARPAERYRLRIRPCSSSGWSRGVLAPAPAPRSRRPPRPGGHADQPGEELAVHPQLLGQHDTGQHHHGGQVHHAHHHEQRHQRPAAARQYAPWWAPARTSRSLPNGGRSESSGRSIRRSFRLVTTSSTLPQGRSCGRPPAAAVLGRHGPISGGRSPRFSCTGSDDPDDPGWVEGWKALRLASSRACLTSACDRRIDGARLSYPGLGAARS